MEALVLDIAATLAVLSGYLAIVVRSDIARAL